MIFRLALLLVFVTVGLGCTRGSSIPENSVQVALPINLKSLDPAQSADFATDEVVPNIFEGLLQFHYLQRPLKVIPQLAASLPEVSKDGLTYTFKIRPGVHFQDSEAFPGGKGREVVAQDFVYSWRRVADPKVQSDGFWIFDGKIKGLNEWRDLITKGQADYNTPIAGLRTPDDHTLVIELTKPNYQLNYVLTMAYAAVVPHEAVDKFGAEFMNHPVGTGPFRFESWIRGNKVVLSKNPTWRGETYPADGEASDKENALLADAGKALPFVEKLVFLELPEDQPRWLNMMKGALDFSEIPKDNFDSAMNAKDLTLKPELAAKGIHLATIMIPDVVYISMNMADPLIGKNLNLRRALSLAYDTTTALERFYNNRGVPAYSPIAPGMEGWDPEFKHPWREFNIEKAKEYLKKAGYPDGKGLPILEYSFAGSTTGRQMAEFTAQQFEKIGVKLNLVSSSWPQFQDRIRKKKSQIFGISWIADYPDPENMFQLLYSKNVSPGSNNANYESPEFDALYDKALLLPPGPERTALYLKMRDVFVKDLPWITTVHRKGYLVSHAWVHNLKSHRSVKGRYKYIRIDTQEKKDAKAKL